MSIFPQGIVLFSDPADVFAAHVGPPSTLTLTSAIDGVGEISGMNLDIAGGPGSIIADGSVSDTTVAANQYADTLTIDAAGPITNYNVLGATNSGALVIKNDVENIGQFATLNARRRHDRYRRRLRYSVGCWKARKLAATSPPTMRLSMARPTAH